LTRDHGYARYKLDGCRCNVCGYANAVYYDRRVLAMRRGQWQPFVNAEPVREHIRALRSCGLGLRTIAQAAGVDRKRLQAVTNGRPDRGTPPQEKVRPELAAAILAVEPTLNLLPDKTVIDGAGVRRRLQALVRVGWSQAKLAERIGWTPSNFTTLLSGRPVTAGSVRLVRGLYDDLWNQAPPEDSHHDKIAANRARNHATAQGWLPPQAWDDDLIDVPDDQLDAELARRVAAMTDQELRDCWNARYRGGDHSPLIAAGARECRNRREAGTLERAS
jgi:transcriptional regulator with XRE-family HTH domain